MLDQVATGYLAPELITSRTAAWDDAIDALLEGTPSKFVLVRHEG